MTRRSRFLAAILGGASAWAASHTHAQCLTEAVWVGTGVSGHWVDNTLSPKIKVTTGNSEDEAEVFLCESVGGFWTVIVQYTLDPGSAGVTIEGLGSARDIASVGVSAFNDFPPLDVALRFDTNIRHVHGVAFGGNIYAFDVHGVVEGDLGSVLATSIGAKAGILPLEVRGDVFGDILLLDTGGNQGIAQMIVRGDILGDITVEFGKIDRLEVDGTIGLVGEGGAVTPVTIKTYGDIDELIAGQIIANITAGAATLNNNPTPADIYLLRSTTLIGGTGHFIGSINARKIVTQLDIRGDLGGGVGKEAIVTLLDPLGIPAGIRIGGSFREDSQINLPSNGLTGTILFNAEDDSGVWESGAVITVGSTPLSQATYTTLPSAVGGGVAGLTDSGFFGAACSPAANSIRSLWPPAYLGDCDDPPTFSGGIAHADLRFRTAVDVDGDSFTVLRTGLGASFNNATDVTTQYEWSYLTGNTSESVIRFSRVGGGDAFLTGYEYRIVPVSGEVRVKHATGTPDVNMTYYQFGVQWSCDLGLLEHFDLNQDEALCSQDIAAWLNDPVDFDGDSVADTTDLGYLG